MNLAHTQRLAIWAEHMQPKGYGGSDLMREDIRATLAEVERLAEILYRLHVAPGVRVDAPADTRKPWEKTSWTCARARVDHEGMHCPPDKCADCPIGVKGLGDVR